MSETRGQQEPSMEEILASIRRIISEDGQEPQSEAKPDQSERKEPKLTQPAPAEEKRVDEKAARPSLRAVGSGDAEILVLTEMVAEDGSVVSLAAQSPAGADLSTTPESVGLPEPPDGPDPTGRKMPPKLDEPEPDQLPDQLEDPVRPALHQPEQSQPEPSEPLLRQPEPSEPVLRQPEPSQLEPSQPVPRQTEPSQLEPSQPVPRQTEPSQPDPEEPDQTQKISVEKVEQPKNEAVELLAEMAPMIDADDRMESEKMSNDARKKLELVSQEAEAASTEAIAELARTVSRDKDMPIDGGRSVEDLVREALKPMLRQWLDANLPELVERVVRSEIQRMVRRAEDKA